MLVLGACGGSEVATTGKNVNLYVLNSTETKLELHEYIIQSKEVNGQVQEVIEQLSIMPSKLEYKPPITFGFSVVKFEVEEGKLWLDVDEAYKSMKATTEVLVRAALVRSFTQISEISYVSITVNGEQLHDSLGNTVGIMTADLFVENAGNEINTFEKVRVKLYFANKEGTGLIATNRTLAYNTNISMERLVVEQIISGPDIKEVYPTLNSGCKLISTTVKDGVCYVNFDATFLTQSNNVSAEVTIYSLVNSLSELSGVNKVQISINGETNLTYRENYPLATIFERNLDLVTTLD